MFAVNKNASIFYHSCGKCLGNCFFLNITSKNKLSTWFFLKIASKNKLNAHYSSVVLLLQYFRAVIYLIAFWQNALHLFLLCYVKDTEFFH